MPRAWKRVPHWVRLAEVRLTQVKSVQIYICTFCTDEPTILFAPLIGADVVRRQPGCLFDAFGAGLRYLGVADPFEDATFR